MKFTKPDHLRLKINHYKLDLDGVVACVPLAEPPLRRRRHCVIAKIISVNHLRLKYGHFKLGLHGVEHDDDLAALLDQDAATLRVEAQLLRAREIGVFPVVHRIVTTPSHGRHADRVCAEARQTILGRDVKGADH